MRLGLHPVLAIILCASAAPVVSAQQDFDVSSQWFISANGTDTLGCDLYLPHESIHTGWGVVFLHGGGFFTGNRDGAASQAYCAALATQGITVMSIDYRLRQVGQGFHCDISISDKREAIRWAAEDLMAAIDAFGARFPAGIIGAGTSAGAEAVLDAVYAVPQSSLKAAISLSGGVEPPKAWRDTPVLAVHGTCDALVPYCIDIHHYCPTESAGALLLAGGGGLAIEGANVELYTIQYAGHELSTSMLTDPFFIERSVDFINSVVTRTFESNSTTIPLYRPCNLSQHPDPSCQ